MKKAYIFLFIGFIFIVAGLLILLVTQNHYVQLQPLQCPKHQKWFA